MLKSKYKFKNQYFAVLKTTLEYTLVKYKKKKGFTSPPFFFYKKNRNRQKIRIIFDFVKKQKQKKTNNIYIGKYESGIISY